LGPPHDRDRHQHAEDYRDERRQQEVHAWEGVKTPLFSSPEQ
jgi:hypothetical protein